MALRLTVARSANYRPVLQGFLHRELKRNTITGVRVWDRTRQMPRREFGHYKSRKRGKRKEFSCIHCFTKGLTTLLSPRTRAVCCTAPFYAHKLMRTKQKQRKRTHPFHQSSRKNCCQGRCVTCTVNIVGREVFAVSSFAVARNGMPAASTGRFSPLHFSDHIFEHRLSLQQKKEDTPLFMSRRRLRLQPLFSTLCMHLDSRESG